MNTAILSIATLFIASLFSLNTKLVAPPAAYPTARIAHTDTTINWEAMSKPERKEYMKTVVMPKMKTIFQTFDAKHFAEFRCTTCHGAGARTGEFKMPNPDLPKLPSTMDGFKKLSQDKPKWMEFMGKTVKPEMADLLGLKPFDPKTGKGFGCGNCHTTEK
ncbi:MAG TPA: hypothetical protein VGM92_00075 [Candidatus Kapabacteria bacterium]|jgi:hypothetical protein